MPTTEIFAAPLKPGCDISDPNNDAAKVLKEITDLLAKAPGCENIYFGMQVENPNMFHLMIIWDKIDSHHAFMKSEEYQPVIGPFLTIIDGAPYFFHADLEPHGEALKVLSAPVTEMAMFYFGSAPSDTFIGGLQKFAEMTGLKGIDGFKGGCFGSTHEEVELEDVKGKGAILMIGWDSVDAHMAFRETDTFKEARGVFTEGPEKAVMKHVQFLPYAKTQ